MLEEKRTDGLGDVGTWEDDPVRLSTVVGELEAVEKRWVLLSERKDSMEVSERRYTKQARI